MQVNLKAGKIEKRQAIKVAFFDAIIWYWFHQVSYESLFAQQIEGLPVFNLLNLLTAFLVGAAIIYVRWDQIPIAFRVVAPVSASMSLIGLLLINSLSLAGTTLEIVCLLFFSASCFGCQILRVENLAKCNDMKTLTAALVGSFFLFYILSSMFLLLPQSIYDVVIIIAPYTLIIGVHNPLKRTERVGASPKRMKTLTPNILVIIFGVAGGFLFSSGSVSSAMTLGEVLTAPSPFFMLMLLLYMDLGVVVSFGLRFKKAMYFVVMNLAWSAGSLLGSFVIQLTPIVPESFSVLVSVATIASYLLFQNTWLNSPTYVVEPTEVISENLAREKGLSNREVEVVLLLLEGRSMRFIQEELYISEGTVRTHTRRIYAKLGVHSKQELIDYFKVHHNKS